MRSQGRYTVDQRNGVATENTTGYFIDGNPVSRAEYLTFCRSITNPPSTSGNKDLRAMLRQIQSHLETLDERIVQLQATLQNAVVVPCEREGR